MGRLGASPKRWPRGKLPGSYVSPTWLTFSWGQLRFIRHYHLPYQGHSKRRDAAHGVAPETDGTVTATPTVVSADEYDVVVPDEGHDPDVVRHHGNRANPRGGRLAVGCVYAGRLPPLG